MPVRSSHSRILPIAFAISLAILLPELVAPFNHDSELYQSIGWLFARFGRIPYLGSWDQNFPGIFYLHAGTIALFGSSPFAFRVVDILAHLISALLAASLVAKYRDRPTAIMAAALCSLDYMYGGYWLAGQRDGFGTLAILGAAAIYLTTRERRSSLWLIVSGLFAGIAVSFRPTFGFMAIALVVAILRYDERKWRRLLLYAVGAIVAWVLILLPYLGSSDALHEFYLAAIRFNLEVHASSKYRGSFLLLLIRPRELVYDLVLIAWVLQWVRTNQIRSWSEAMDRMRKAPVHAFLFAACYFTARLSVVLMGKYFISHYDPLTVMTAILAAIVIRSYLSQHTQSRALHYAPRVILVLLIIGLYAASMLPAFASNILSGKGTSLHALHEARFNGVNDWQLEYDDVAGYLDRHGACGQKLQVWGWSLGLYWRAGCDAGSRFTFMLPLVMTRNDGILTDYQRVWQREFVDSLQHASPRFIVVAKDSMGLGVFYPRAAAMMIDSVPGFREVLNQSYRLDTAMWHWDVYERNTAPR
jgi:hypothetical protein